MEGIKKAIEGLLCEIEQLESDINLVSNEVSVEALMDAKEIRQEKLEVLKDRVNA